MDDERLLVAKGIILAEPIIELVRALLADEPRSHHIAMVGLLHACIRVEVFNRIPGRPPTAYRANMHAILDDVMDYEEKERTKGL